MSIKRKINNISIKSKMIISYIMIVTAAVAAVAVVMFIIFSNRYEKQILYSASQSFSQANEFLGYRVDSVMYASNILQVDTQTQEILKREEKDISNDLIQQNKDMIYMENLVYSLCNSTDIFQISIYVPDYFIYVDQEVIFRNLNTFEKSLEYQNLVEAGNSGMWVKPEEIYSADTSKWVNVISFLRLIKDKTDLNRTIGVQRVSVKFDDIYSILENSKITENGLVFLENENGELMAASNENQYQKFKVDLMNKSDKPTAVDINVNSEKTSDKWMKYEINGSNYYVKKDTLKNTNSTLVIVIPEAELFKDFKKIITIMTVVLIIILILAAMFAVIFSRFLTLRLSKLMHQMEDFEKKEKTDTFDEQDMGSDEIGSLFVSFNNMETQINELIKNEYENGKAVKQAELKALQAQINPHFLYNTLDLINWKALDCGADSIVDISQSLAKYYRLSLNKGKEMSTLKEELNHIKYYVQIQNYRFENRIKMTVNCAEDLYNCTVLHIILQPLVENSIVHGMKELEENENIYITVSVNELSNKNILSGREKDVKSLNYYMEDYLEIEIEDTGCGVDTEKMNNSLIVGFDGDGGYGVKNINTRIKLCYGDRYGLTYKENSFGGTSVLVKIPKIMEGK